MKEIWTATRTERNKIDKQKQRRTEREADNFVGGQHRDSEIGRNIDACLRREIERGEDLYVE